MLRCELVWDSIGRRVFWQRAMERSVEGGNHRNCDPQKRSCGANAAHARRVVQRGDLTQGIESVNDVFINQNGGRESLSSVNHTMPHGVKRSQLRMGAQPFDSPANRLFVVTNRCGFLLFGNAGSFKPKRSGIAYAIDDAVSQSFDVAGQTG